jgi:hypothetical protein
VSLTFHSALRKFNTEPSIGTSHQISVHFGKAVSDKKISSEALWPNDMKLGKKHLWKILYRDYSFHFDPFSNMAATAGKNLYRCILPSFGSFGQAVSEKIFRNRPIRNKNCLLRLCLLMDRDEMSNRYRLAYF